MTAPKLTYFDFPGGRGEASRLAFEVAGVPWVDDRFSGDWPATKPSIPYGGLPLLDVPGQGQLSQSNAILEWIGRSYGLLPQDAFEAARHVAVMNAIEELRAQASTTTRDDDDAKRIARVAFANGYFQQWAKGTSAQIRGPFIGGDDISVADLKLYVAMRSYSNGVYDHIPVDILDAFPGITALCSAVEAHPAVAAWQAR